MWIKDCPFCGGRPQTINRALCDEFYVRCKVYGSRTAGYRTKEKAREWWNCRGKEDAQTHSTK